MTRTTQQPRLRNVDHLLEDRFILKYLGAVTDEGERGLRVSPGIVLPPHEEALTRVLVEAQQLERGSNVEAVADKLRRIGHGEDPKRVHDVARSRGQPSPPPWMAIEAELYRRCNRCSTEHAHWMTSRNWGVEAEAVSKAVDRSRSFVDDIIRAWIAWTRRHPLRHQYTDQQILRAHLAAISEPHFRAAIRRK